MICKKWRLDLPKIPTQISFAALSKRKIKALNVCTKPNYEFASISGSWRCTALTGKNWNKRQTHYFQEVKQDSNFWGQTQEKGHIQVFQCSWVLPVEKKREIESEEKKIVASLPWSHTNPSSYFNSYLIWRDIRIAKKGNSGVPTVLDSTSRHSREALIMLTDRSYRLPWLRAKVIFYSY